MTERFSSQYRFQSISGNGDAILLVDTVRDDSVWVTLEGYGSEILDVLQELEMGNVVEATIASNDDIEENLWRIEEISLLRDERLDFFETDDFTIGPTDMFWEERPEEATVYSAGRWDDNEDNILYEVQVQSDAYMDGAEEKSVIESLFSGELLLEGMFSGESSQYFGEDGLDYIDPDVGVNRVVILNPSTKPYIVAYLFPPSEFIPEGEDRYAYVHDTLFEKSGAGE